MNNAVNAVSGEKTVKRSRSWPCGSAQGGPRSNGWQRLQQRSCVSRQPRSLSEFGAGFGPKGLGKCA
jgi:hypothetical protein